MTASFRRKLILSLASSLAALILVTGGVGIQRKLATFRSPGITLGGGLNRVVVAQADPALQPGLRQGDRLLLIGGDTVRRISSALERLREQPSTEIVVQRGDEIVTVSYVRPGLAVDWAYLAQAVIGGLYLLIGLYTVLREQSRQSLLFYLWCAASSAFFILVSNPVDQLVADDTGKALYVVEELARLLLPPLTLHFFLSFPVEIRGWTRRLVPFFYLPAAVLAALQWDLIANDGRYLLGSPNGSAMAAAVERLDRAEMLTFISFALIAAMVLLYRLLVGERREARRQLLWIALGMAGGYVSFAALYAIPWLLGLEAPEAIQIIAVLPLAVVPLTFAYAILRFRLWDISVIARDVATYGLTILFGLTGFMFLRMLVQQGVPASRGMLRDLLSVAAVFVVGGLLVPARQGIGTALERLQYRTKYGKRRNLAQLGRELLHERDLERLSSQLLIHVEEALSLDRSNLLLNEDEHLVPLRRMDGTVGTLPIDLFGAEFWDEDHLELPGTTLPGSGSAAASDLYARGYRYAFPLLVRGRRVGALVCGLRYGEMPFSSDDLDLVRTLLDQASLAIENAHLLDRLQTQLEEMRELKHYTESIIEASPAGIVVLDDEGRIQSANLAFAALAGADPDGIRRRALLDVIPLERVPRPEDGLIELGMIDGRGRERSIQASVAPFSSERGAAVVLVINDISDRVAMERKLEEKERLASLGIMAAGIAHEVNTPITGISSYAQMLLDTTERSDPRYPLLEKVERQTFRASRIVNSLLELARNKQVAAAPVDLAELVAECLELLHERIESTGIRVEVRNEAQSAIANGSDGELQQVFTNLFLNAMDAMSDTGGRLTIEAVPGAAKVTVRVQDSGPGIPADKLERIFQPFYSTKLNRGGTGLGLSISYEIVRRHGGDLRVASQPGEGACFLVELPRYYHPSSSTSA